MMNTLVSGFLSLDETLQGVIIAGAISLIGIAISLISVIVTVVVTWLIGRAQLSQQAEQANLTRAFELKKDALLQAVDGIADAIGSFGMLADVGVETEAIGARYQAGALRATRAFAVADIDTVVAMRKLTEAGISRFSELMSKRHWLLLAHNDVVNNDKFARDYWEKYLTLNELLSSEIRSGRSEDDLKILMRQVDFQLDNWRRLSKEHSAALDEQTSRQAVVLFECFKAINELQHLYTKFVGALRKEVKVDGKFSPDFLTVGLVDSTPAVENIRRLLLEAGGPMEPPGEVQAKD